MSNPGSQQDLDYRLVAKALWDLNAEKLKFTAQVHADYGKWLLVTITTTHLAAIYLLSQPAVPTVIREHQRSYWPFVIGLCLALICGLITWLNWSLSAVAYNNWMQPDMLINSKSWPTTGRRLKFWLPITFYLPLAIGAISACCIPWGTYEVFQIKETSTAYVITQPPAVTMP